jgi:putative tryptophan/tyrosine transport system substrate-binding protein
LTEDVNVDNTNHSRRWDFGPGPAAWAAVCPVASVNALSKPVADMPVQSVRRRQFITVLGAAAAMWPLASAAQYGKLSTVGVLIVGLPDPAPFLRAFREGLRETGYNEGQNLQLDIRSAEGKSEALPELAAELVHRKVDVIVGFQTPAVQAAKQATTEIPIVMDAGDPVGMGLVESLARPGGNITGMSASTAELAQKNLEFLRQILPSFRRLALFLNATDPFRKPFFEQNQLGAGHFGIELQTIFVNRPGELDLAFETAASERVDAAMIQPSLPLQRAAELALAHRLPAASVTRSFAEVGGLMSYSANYAELWHEMAVYVAKILKGARPADLPVEQPTKFELVINLKTARAIGIEIPTLILARADEVIE